MTKRTERTEKILHDTAIMKRTHTNKWQVAWTEYKFTIKLTF